jgi:hypothetical protein
LDDDDDKVEVNDAGVAGTALDSTTRGYATPE